MKYICDKGNFDFDLWLQAQTIDISNLIPDEMKNALTFEEFCEKERQKKLEENLDQESR